MQKAFITFAIACICFSSLSFIGLKAQESSGLPPIQAASGVSAPIPDVSTFPFIQNLRASGAKIYFLGQKFGLNGWFANKDERIQIFYTTPDNKGLFVGSLLAADGTNISQQQTARLVEGEQKIKEVLNGYGQPATIPTITKKGNLPGVGLTKTNPPVPDFDSAKRREEQIYNDLQRGAQIVFGKDGLPQVAIVLDVNDEPSKKVWKRIESYVDDGKLQVVMMPFTVSGSQSETDAANLFQKKEPYESWKRHLAGEVEIIRTGKVDVELEDIINATTQLMVRHWKMDKPPYIFYHTKEGKLQMVSDFPQSIDVFLTEIAKATPISTGALSH